MNIQHFEKGLYYNDQDLLLVAKKLGKLATYCKRVKDEDSFIRIEAERRNTKKERDSIRVAVSVALPNKTLFADSLRATAIEALDRCIEKLEPQVKRFKEMYTSKDRYHTTRGKPARKPRRM